MAMGSMQNKMAPLISTTGEIITDKGQQMERWVEQYSDLYSRQNVLTTAALNAIEIDSLASGKSPGSDGIPPNLIKHARLPYCFHCTKSSACAGKKGPYHWT